MISQTAPHDDRLLDALDALGSSPYSGTVWRMVRDDGRSVFDESRGSGRFNPSELKVLYTAEEKNGAIAEINYHLSRGQSVFPSKIIYKVHKLSVIIQRTLNLVDMTLLEGLDVDPSLYKGILYKRTQEIGAAAAFLGFDGLIAPSARWNCQNVVLFLDAIDLDDLSSDEGEVVNWTDWRANHLK